MRKKHRAKGIRSRLKGVDRQRESSAPAGSTKIRTIFPVLVFGLTALAFLPSLNAGFIRTGDYDDLVANPHYRGFGWDHLRWVFTTFHMDNYRPLTWLSFALDYTFWGMNPFGYHLTSLLLHSMSAVLVYFISSDLLRLAFPISPKSSSSQKRSGASDLRTADIFSLNASAAIAALIFSVHPLRTETVAWVAARGHLLSGLFFLSSVGCYVRAVTNTKTESGRRFYLAAVICYGLSLLSQPGTVSLPFILLMIDVYPLKRWARGGLTCYQRVRALLWEKVPFILLACGGALIAAIAKHGRVVGADLDPLRRLALSTYGAAFYAWKIVAPLGLYPSYEVRFHFDPWRWPFLISALVLILASFLAYTARHRWPAVLPAWLSYLILVLPYTSFVLPVIGTAENGRQITADRYSYLICLPWGILAAAYFHSHWQALRQRGAIQKLVLFSTPFAAGLLLLAALAWRQTQFWHDSYSLWNHAAEASERSLFKSAVAQDHLGVALAEQGKIDDAIRRFYEALRISPHYAQALNNLGAAVGKEGKFDEAIADFREALRISPNYEQAHFNLGLALAKEGKLREAVAQYSEALEINPEYIDAQKNLKLALASMAAARLEK